jgi:hypothetical protein
MEKYFFEVRLIAGESQEETYFIPVKKSDNIDEKTPPQLTVEMVKTDFHFMRFDKQYSPKKAVAVDYKIMKTAELFDENTVTDDFFKLIVDSKKAETIAQSELTISNSSEKKAKKSQVKLKKFKQNKNPKNAKNNKIKQMLLCGGSAILALFIGIAIGNSMNKKAEIPAAVDGDNVEELEEIKEDGMLIPIYKTPENPDIQQISVIIDRSYSPIPTEDFQIKAEIIDGKATITLPKFDNTDFFHHVFGYTYGFSTVPNAEKIEYYGGGTYEFKTDVKLYRVLVKYGGGKGTKSDPYRINYYDQLELLAQEGETGFFVQVNDIYFPNGAYHTSINTITELKNKPSEEFFEYDGNGYSIENLSAPLFGKVSGAILKNIHIKNSYIYSQVEDNYGFIVSQAINYKYELEGNAYETGETTIQNCTVMDSSINLSYPPPPEGEETANEVQPAEEPIITDENGNNLTPPPSPPPTKYGEFSIGAISGIGGKIENCYVSEVTILADLDNYFLYVGGISGKPNVIRNSAVYGSSIDGKIFNAGGIAGTASGTRKYNAIGVELPEVYGGNIQGCFVRNTSIIAENAVGGIVGTSTTDAENAIISNCYTLENVLFAGSYKDEKRTELEKIGFVGGIIGMDGADKNGHFITNCVAPDIYYISGNSTKSIISDSIINAPLSAFSLESILEILNQNSVIPDSPSGEMFAGEFMFEINKNSDMLLGVYYAFPLKLYNLIPNDVFASEQSEF